MKPKNLLRIFAFITAMTGFSSFSACGNSTQEQSSVQEVTTSENIKKEETQSNESTKEAETETETKTASTGIVNFSMEAPSEAMCRVILEFESDGICIARSNLINTKFFNGPLITSVEGTGIQQISVILVNNVTKQRAELGVYNFDFNDASYDIVHEDIDAAFKAISGTTNQKEVETKTNITEPVTEKSYQKTTDFLITDLSKKTPSEIIQLMNGKYTIETGLGDSYYLENNEIFPNVSFALNTGGYYSNSADASQDKQFISKLESDEFTLSGIQVGCIGAAGITSYVTDKNAVYYITDKITSGLSYREIADLLGEFSCVPSTGGMSGGDLSSAEYVYNENNCEIKLNFSIEDEKLYSALISSGKASSEIMYDVNPMLYTVVVYNKKQESKTENETYPETEAVAAPTAKEDISYKGTRNEYGFTEYFTLTFDKSNNCFYVDITDEDGMESGFDLPVSNYQDGIYTYTNGESFYRNSLTYGRIPVASGLSGTLEVKSDSKIIWHNFASDNVGEFTIDLET